MPDSRQHRLSARVVHLGRTRQFDLDEPDVGDRIVFADLATAIAQAFWVRHLRVVLDVRAKAALGRLLDEPGDKRPALVRGCRSTMPVSKRRCSG
jgi:hypothetical protein